MTMPSGEDSLELLKAEWYIVSQRRGNSEWPDLVTLADGGTLERDGENAFMWIRMVQPKHLQGAVAALDVRLQFNCEDGRNRPVSQRLVGAGDFQIDRRDEEPNGYFDPAPEPGNVNHEFLELACSDSANWTDDYSKRRVEGDSLEWAHGFLSGED